MRLKLKLLRSSAFAWIGMIALWLSTGPAAQAHIQRGEVGGFASGFKHPWSGLDHIAAMVSVGLWGAQLGKPAIWLLPVTFPMVMAFGGFLGLIGVPLPGVEIGIGASAFLLGIMVMLEVKPKHLVWAAVLVGIFGLYHGHAHGTELPPGQSGLLYSIGFVVATGTLHACGIAIGGVHYWEAGKKLIRALGLVVVLIGTYFLWEAFQPQANPVSPAPSAQK